ncbi:MAG: DUF1080 domain-containing protein [Acidobacteria bacterium]|nr:DUF1080 domain-containing protein [Acidobacteriota bacterium]
MKFPTASLLIVLAVSLPAQQPKGPGANATPEQRARMRAMGPPQPAPKDDPSFKAIFNGASLDGWEGDTRFWRAEGGLLIGQTSAENPIKQNTFLIWKGGNPADFELRLEYKLASEAGNSGIQYRSELLPDRQFGLKGYQSDIDSENRFTGLLYEEAGRGFLAPRGVIARIEAGEPVTKHAIGAIGDPAALSQLIRKQDWNEIHIIAKGSTLVQIMNGQVMSVTIDNDPAGRRASGLLGLQLHVGPPMRIEFRNIRLKQL